MSYAEDILEEIRLMVLEREVIFIKEEEDGEQQFLYKINII